MRVRALLWLTAIVSSILGGVAVYLAMSVPNDLQADAMLKSSREQLAKGNTDEARKSLARIVQQYPRTDAAAAATLALLSIADQDRAKLRAEMTQLRGNYEEQAKELTNVRTTVDTVKNAPPRVVTVQAPAPKKAPTVKKAPTKKKTPTRKKTTPTKRRKR